jgi:amino acid transporter
MADSHSNQKKMGFNATWSMAVGGMIGGGIFSVLGIVVFIAGQWAWLSFVIGGLIAIATGFAYSKLAEQYGEGGGAFTFLREIHREGFAGSLSWVLIFGYILTISVYAFTFGHYLGNMFGLGAWFPRVCSATIIGVLIGVNLRGVGEASGLEIVTVWGKLLVLVGLAALGLWHWQPDLLTQGIQTKGLATAIEGAASVFMAYEGFQLLTYDYDDIRTPKKILPRAMIAAIITVILVYVLVALGVAMIVGAGTIVEKKEVAIAVAGQVALGSWGLILATIAAVFSTVSAINATLFATARLTQEVARDKEIPRTLGHENKKGIPDRAVLIIGGGGAVLAFIGSLESLVEAASLVFLFTFATVNFLAFRQIEHKRRWVFGVGTAGASAAGLYLLWRLIHVAPFVLGLLAFILLAATLGRPIIMRHGQRKRTKKTS